MDSLRSKAETTFGPSSLTFVSWVYVLLHSSWENFKTLNSDENEKNDETLEFPSISSFPKTLKNLYQCVLSRELASETFSQPGRKIWHLVAKCSVYWRSASFTALKLHTGSSAYSYISARGTTLGIWGVSTSGYSASKQSFLLTKTLTQPFHHRASFSARTRSSPFWLDGILFTSQQKKMFWKNRRTVWEKNVFRKVKTVFEQLRACSRRNSGSRIITDTSIVSKEIQSIGHCNETD